MPYGMGFVLTPEERDALIQKNKKNAERIFPYLGGEEVNTNPDQGFDRYVIDFGAMTLEEAGKWPDLLEIVRAKVKPERDQNKRDHCRTRWWQYGEYRPGLYAAIRPIERCLVTAQITKHLVFSFQSTNQVFTQKVVVFPIKFSTCFATLQSRIHVAWAWLLSSTLGANTLSYSSTDCFANFPFPHTDPRTVIPELEAIGERLYETRRAFMLDTQQGLTKTYNALKDPSFSDRTTLPRIEELRELHLELDRAVLCAYGWDDLIASVPPFTTPKTDAEKTALQTFQDAVIDRLFDLNKERHLLECQQCHSNR